MNRKEDTPQRIIRRKYEEKHKDERQAAHKVWGTSVDRSLANEIDDFLIKHNIKKVELIYAGFKDVLRAYKEETTVLRTKVLTFSELMPDALINDLIIYMEWFRQADALFDERLDEYYLAVNVYRLPIFPQSIGQYLKRYERQWGMKEVTCHGLRHTYCSLLLSQNVPIQTVSKYMGHSDSTVTVNNQYGHTIINNIIKAVIF